MMVSRSTWMILFNGGIVAAVVFTTTDPAYEAAVNAAALNFQNWVSTQLMGLPADVWRYLPGNWTPTSFAEPLSVISLLVAYLTVLAVLHHLLPGDTSTVVKRPRDTYRSPRARRRRPDAWVEDGRWIVRGLNHR